LDCCFSYFRCHSLDRVKNPFLPGDKKVYETTVTEDKLACFEAGMVHPVYSTFALGKDAEWACRLFVLEMKETGEEGIGSYLSIEHCYPAPLGSQVRIEATLEKISGNEVICNYEAFANGFLIAVGKQSQKIIDKSRFDNLIKRIEIK
jgi:fluoroacetyl-CoA thioesterase